MDSFLCEWWKWERILPWPYFDSLEVEYITKEIKTFIANKTIITNNLKKKIYNSIMCGQNCVLFIDWMLECKSLLGYIIFFSTEKYENNDSVILKYFQ